jgi:hypothetical protein
MLSTFPNFALNVFRIHLALTVAVIVLQDLLLNLNSDYHECPLQSQEFLSIFQSHCKIQKSL